MTASLLACGLAGGYSDRMGAARDVFSQWHVCSEARTTLTTCFLVVGLFVALTTSSLDLL